MSDFGVPMALNMLPSQKVNQVVRFLREDLGVEEPNDLAYVEVEDLTKNGLLKKIQAKRLVGYWKQELAASASGHSRGNMQPGFAGNVGRVVNASDYTETNNQAGTINNFGRADNVQTGGTRSGAVYHMRDVKGHGAFAGSNQTTNYGNLNQNIH